MPRHDAQPSLQHRILAAAGASVVSAVLVNPLDVIKTRVQAASMVPEKPTPSCLLTRVPARFPVRWARPASLADATSRFPSPCSIGSTTQHSGAPASQLHRSALLGQLPMSSCACALKVQDLDPEVLRLSQRCLSGTPFRPATATGVLRDMVAKEGLASLWRGTDTAILASIPMVGVYMPLYDNLMHRTAAPLGPYAPVVAGSAARTLAVLLVGPLELARTRQQGGSSGAGNAWAALRDTLREAGAASGSSSGAEPAAAKAAAPRKGGLRLPTGLASVTRLWTGVGATLARDVPFSAIYWGLVEPIRGGLLERWAQQQQAESSALHGAEQQQQQEQHTASGREVLAANLIAGSSAGAAAAVVTTPFDVVKTRLQVGDVRVRQTGMAVLRRVVQQEGLRGLFRGWVPRAARTAPACAVVVASYEVLKLLL